MIKKNKLYAVVAMMVASVLCSMPVSASSTTSDDDGKDKMVPCSKFGLPMKDRVECFDGGEKERLYLGSTFALTKLSNWITNPNDMPIFLFTDTDPFGNKGLVINKKPLQGTAWTESNADKTFGFAENSNNLSYRTMNVKGVDYNLIEFAPKTSQKFVEMTEGTGFFFAGFLTESDKQKADRNKPIFHIEYIIRTYGAIDKNGTYIVNGKVSSVTHSHAFYYGAWCGDGVVDEKFGEVYDDGMNNGKPGFATTDCKNKL